MIEAEIKQARLEVSQSKKETRVNRRAQSISTKGALHCLLLFLLQLQPTNNNRPFWLSAPLMLIRRPDVIHRQRGSLIRPRLLMIPELVFMNLAAAKQTWQQNNHKTTETSGRVEGDQCKAPSNRNYPSSSARSRLREPVLGVRGQAGRSPTLDPQTNICGQRRFSLQFPDAESTYIDTGQR